MDNVADLVKVVNSGEDTSGDAAGLHLLVLALVHDAIKQVPAPEHLHYEVDGHTGSHKHVDELDNIRMLQLAQHLRLGLDGGVGIQETGGAVPPAR